MEACWRCEKQIYNSNGYRLLSGSYVFMAIIYAIRAVSY